MKKISAILAVLVILVLAGCASSGGGSGSSAGSSGSGRDPYSVDLSTLKVAMFSDSTGTMGAPIEGIRNKEPFPKQWDGLVYIFPEFPDVTAYSRVTLRCKYFNANGEEIDQGDSNAMVVMIYDVNGDKKGPEMGSGPNTPLKEFNVGGFSGTVSTDRGSRVNLKQNPGGVLFQANTTNVKYIEVTEITFHN